MECVARRVATGDHALAHLDGEHTRVDGPEDLIHLADLLLVGEEDGGVEVGDLLVGQLANRLAFANVVEGADLLGGVRGAGEGRGGEGRGVRKEGRRREGAPAPAAEEGEGWSRGGMEVVVLAWVEKTERVRFLCRMTLRGIPQ